MRRPTSFSPRSILITVDKERDSRMRKTNCMRLEFCLDLINKCDNNKFSAICADQPDFHLGQYWSHCSFVPRSHIAQEALYLFDEHVVTWLGGHHALIVAQELGDPVSEHREDGHQVTRELKHQHSKGGWMGEWVQSPTESNRVKPTILQTLILTIHAFNKMTSAGCHY